MKEAILENYTQVAENFTFKLLNHCIVQMQIKRIASFTQVELQRHGVLKMIMKFMPNCDQETVEKYIEKLFPRARLH